MASSPVPTPSRMPKPWPIVKKSGIIPDWLVQAWLSHFRQLTNQGSGIDNKDMLIMGSSNGKAEKRQAGNLDSLNAGKQMRY